MFLEVSSSACFSKEEEAFLPTSGNEGQHPFRVLSSKRALQIRCELSLRPTSAKMTQYSTPIRRHLNIPAAPPIVFADCAHLIAETYVQNHCFSGDSRASQVEPPLGSHLSLSGSVWNWLRHIVDVTVTYRPTRDNAQLNTFSQFCACCSLSVRIGSLLGSVLFTRKFKFVCTRTGPSSGRS